MTTTGTTEDNLVSASGLVLWEQQFSAIGQQFNKIKFLIIADIFMVIAVQQKLFLDEFEDFGGTFHFGVAEEIDAEGEHGGAVGLSTDVALQTGKAAFGDANPVA